MTGKDCDGLSGRRKDHSMPSGLAGLDTSRKKVSLDDVPRRARQVSHMIDKGGYCG